ncbi:MAG: tyrosine-type recombinase/integrase [Clostridiales bacterium]|jgi:site-specific recombinase XerD|nr:tyrosine-type recombinase/integrase [Clostridiales bacterium]
MRAAKESAAIALYINAFLNVCMPSRKTKSGHAVKSCGEALTLHIAFLESEKSINGGNLRADCFSAENIESRPVWLRDKRGDPPETCNVRLASLRAFVKYLGEQDVKCLCLSQAASQIGRRKTAAPKVVGMSKEAALALPEAPDVSAKAGRRDVALMAAMYGTAARISGILPLKIEHLHINEKKPCITVIGKGDKIRTLYLLPKTAARLKAYIRDARGDSPLPGSYVFYSRNKGCGGRMRQNAVNKQLKKHAAAAHRRRKDVPLDVHAHQLRRAKASHWLEDGVNIVQISFLLGRAQLETTMVYLDITAEQEAKALATLEDENDKAAPKHWTASGKSLDDVCGLRQLKS